MALPKVIIQLYLMFPSDGEEGRRANRAMGNDPDTYQWVVHEWTEIVKACEDMGVWGMSTIELLMTKVLPELEISDFAAAAQ